MWVRVPTRRLITSNTARINHVDTALCPNSRAGRIVWLLEELALPYDINKMAFHPQDLKSEAHRARHPLGRVPVLDDGDVRIFESVPLWNMCWLDTKRRVETGGDRR